MVRWNCWNGQKNEINKYVNYIGNRLFVFDASLPHQRFPMAVSRQCYQLRTCVVLKLLEVMQIQKG